uniref:C-type LECtin n=1 Tax=Plectus sambesii TaxID=2011161 RepID=A0A914UPI7_9BILA
MLLASLIVFCFLFTAAAGQCSNSQFTYSSVDNRCYYASKSSAQWAVARSACHNMGAELAIIHDGNTNVAVDQVGAAVNTGLIFWIGLQVTGGSFQWTDGSIMDYASWNTGFPQLVKGYDCVGERMLSRGVWENLACANSYPYICQANATYVPTTTTAGPFVCHNNPYYGPTGTITSPNYPSNYPNNAQCLYNIILSPSAVVHLHINDIYTEACCDFLNIYNGPSNSYPLLARCAGQSCSSGLVDFYSSSNAMTLQFVSDPSVNYRGFNVSFSPFYQTTTLPSITSTIQPNCATYNGTSSGEFFSLNYPSNYNNNLNCAYILNALSGRVPSIYFRRFQTEYGFDTLSFYDDSAVTVYPNGQISVHGSPYLRLSGSAPEGQTYLGQTQRTVLIFTTDASGVFPGFDGQWTSAFMSSSAATGMPVSTTRASG